MDAEALREVKMPSGSRQLRGLALSGGGFRATIFHLGVIRYLRETNRLRDLSYVSSVSGGSVSAAHLILNWDRYTGSNEEFKRAANEIVAFVQSDARGQVFSRWILGWAVLSWFVVLPILVAWYWEFGWKAWLAITIAYCILAIVRKRFSWPKSRSRLLENGYQKHLFQDRTLPQLKVPNGPKLLIAATDLTSGDLWYFSDDGVTHTTAGKTLATSNPTVALAVASSSAFPPAFGPIKIDSGLLSINDSQLEIPHYLTDGGVYDNLGGRLLEFAGLKEEEIIVSSAEPKPDIEAGSRFGLLVKRAERSTNILMQRVSELESACRSKAVHIRLQDDDHDSKIPISVQFTVRTMRTDLNRFSPLEVQLLYVKGYEAAKTALPEEMTEAFHYEDGIPMAAHDGHWLPIETRNIGLAKGADERAKSRFKIVRLVGWQILRAIAITLAPFVLAVLLYFLSLWMPPMWLESHAKRWNQTEAESQLLMQNPWLDAFLTSSQSFQANSGDDLVTAQIESDPIEDSFLSLRPNSFDCYVGTNHPTGRIVSCQPFLKNQQGELYRILEITKVGKELKVHVESPQRGDTVVVLLGLSWPKNAEPDLVKKYVTMYLKAGELQ